MKAAELQTDKLVAIYIQLRDRRAQRKAAFENDDASDKSKQEKIESILLERFNESGTESVRTEAGTAYKSTRTSVTTADRDTLLGWVRENEAWDFLDVKPNKTNVVDFRNEHDDLPPGINWREEVTINVRRA